MQNIYTKLLFGGIVIVLVSVSLLTYNKLNQYAEEVQWARHSNKVIRAAQVVFSTVRDAETGHRGYQLTRDTVYLEPYYNSLKILPGQLKSLDSLLSYNEKQLKRSDTLNTLINSQFAIISQILSNAKRSSLYMDRYESRLLAEGKDNMDAIRSLIKRISDDEEKVFQVRSSNERDFRLIAPIALLAYSLMALAAVSILFVRILEALKNRKIADEKLKENVKILEKEIIIREFAQKTLRNVLDNSLDGIMAFKSVRTADKHIEDFEWIMANVIASKSVGKSEEELVGKKLLAVMPGNRQEGLFDLYKMVVETGRPHQIEKLYQHEGLNNWYNITAVKLDDGFIVTFSDITNKKEQRLLIEERELLLKEAEKLANMGSWKWEEGVNEMVWSDGLYNILNTGQSSIKPNWESFVKNIYKEDQQLMKEFLYRVKSKREGSQEFYRVELNGGLKYFSITAKPRKTDDNNSVDILGIVIDITEQKLHENRLKQYTAELQRSNEDLEQFAYVASHDLQEPLRKIRAFGDLLAGKYQQKLEDAGADYIHRMQSAATRMQLLIEDLLSFSRVSRNNVSFEKLDVDSLMVEILDDLDIQITREGATIDVERKIPKIHGDRGQIKRLLQNLISNAIKFHKAGEKPDIKIYGELVKKNQIENELDIVFPDPEYVRICVKDNGIGFDEKYSEKIFNIFQRLHGRMEYEGTGIGLAICRKIVTNHRGYITARSLENIGSEFILILPIN